MSTDIQILGNRSPEFDEILSNEANSRLNYEQAMEVAMRIAGLRH